MSMCEEEKEEGGDRTGVEGGGGRRKASGESGAEKPKCFKTSSPT